MSDKKVDWDKLLNNVVVAGEQYRNQIKVRAKIMSTPVEEMIGVYRNRISTLRHNNAMDLAEGLAFKFADGHRQDSDARDVETLADAIQALMVRYGA